MLNDAAFVSGSTIHLAASCTGDYASFTTPSKSYRLKGAGIGSTILRATAANGITFTVPSTGHLMVADMTWTSSVITNSWSFIVSGTASGGEVAGPKVRIRNVRMDNTGTYPPLFRCTNVRLLGVNFNWISATTGTGQNPGSVVQCDYEAWAGDGTIGHKSWQSDSTFATTDQVVLEDSEYRYGGTAWQTCIEGNRGGGRITVRKSTLDGCTVGGHGLGTGSHSGWRHREIYNNTLTATNATSPAYGTQLRSGTGLIHNNVWSHATRTPNNLVKLWAERGQDLMGVGGWSSDHSAADLGFTPLNDAGETAAVGGAAGLNFWDSNDTGGIGSTSLYDSGIATSATTSYSVCDSTKSWTVNEWTGGRYVVLVTNGTRQFARGGAIISNTATCLSTTDPKSNGSAHSFQSGDAYEIRRVVYAADQPGLGKRATNVPTTSTAATAPTSSIGNTAQTSEPVYMWGWTASPGSLPSVANTVASIPTGPSILLKWFKPGQDYFVDRGTTAFDCVFTAPVDEEMVKSGTAAAKGGYTGCTAGAGFWVTDEGNWDLTKAANTSGKFYRHNGTDWVAWYGTNCTGGSPTCTTAGEPLVYPHPWNFDALVSDTATTSTISTSDATVLADNSDTATITVTLITDSGPGGTGHRPRGKTIALTDGACTSTITTSPATTDINGQATFTVKNSTAETCTYTASCTACNGTDALTITATTQVQFTGGVVSTDSNRGLRSKGLGR